MTKKLDVLVDTVVVINAHENGYWEHLCNKHCIYLPNSVIEDEAFYFTSNKGKTALTPSKWLQQKKAFCIEAQPSDIVKLTEKLSNDFLHTLDSGELEALAILLSENYPELLFTTADKAAVKALGVLNLSYKGISVECLLKHLPSAKNKLKPHFKKDWFIKGTSEGLLEQNLFLKKEPLITK